MTYLLLPLSFCATAHSTEVDVIGFFSSGGGVTFSTDKLPRVENIFEDKAVQSAYLNEVSLYHQEISPTILEISSRFNAARDNKIGLQFLLEVTDRFDLNTQMLAKAYHSDFNFMTNWAYGAYNLNPHITLRAGRLRAPLHMHSPYLDVGYTYPWVRVPMEVYDGSSLSHYSGGDILFYGTKGLYDYHMTLGVGSAHEGLLRHRPQALYNVANIVTGSLDLGERFKRLYFSATHYEAKPYEDRGLEKVDLAVDNLRTLYSTWLVSQLEASSSRSKLFEVEGYLGQLYSKTLESVFLLTGSGSQNDWNDLLKELNPELSLQNLNFLQSICASRVAQLTSGQIYGEKGAQSSSDTQLLEAYRQSFQGSSSMPLIRGFIDNLDNFPLESLDAIKAQVTTMEQALALADLRAYDSNPATAVDNTAITNALLTLNLNPSEVLLGGPTSQSQFVDQYKIQNTNKAFFASQEIVGTLSTLGAQENIEKFQAISTLYQIYNQDPESNYGLLVQNFQELVDQSYALTLRAELVRLFNYTWRSGSFFNTGLRYETDTWHFLGEYCYKRSPGYLANANQYYLTIGYRYLQWNPHLTYAEHRTRQKALRGYASNLREGNSTLLDDWKNMFDFVLEGGSSPNPPLYENMLFILDQLQDYWVADQALDQYSWTLGLRYDWPMGICFKADCQYIAPAKGHRGFYDLWDLSRKQRGYVLSMSFDAVF